MFSLDELRDALRTFARDRDWDQFHSPKNLAMALSVEVGELMEPLQWLSDAESRDPSSDIRAALQEELADVLIYLVRLADKLDVDLLAAADAKVRANATKYPVEKARGHSRKYTTFESGSGTER